MEKGYILNWTLRDRNKEDSDSIRVSGARRATPSRRERYEHTWHCWFSGMAVCTVAYPGQGNNELLSSGAHLCAFKQQCISSRTGGHIYLEQPKTDFRASPTQNLKFHWLNFLWEGPLSVGFPFVQSMSLHLLAFFFKAFSQERSEEGSMPSKALSALPFTSNIMHCWDESA